MSAIATIDVPEIVASVPKGLYIGGAWVDAEGGALLAVDDPGTGETLCEVADASADDALRALACADAAREAWAAQPPRHRGELLRGAFERIVADRDRLAALMTLEMGKPLAESHAEVTYAAEYFRWFAEEAVRIDGRWSLAPDGTSRLVVGRRPVGPCLLITPWNFPLAMGTRKIGPALAAGCTMVVKPARQTPLSMLALTGILHDVGVPPGVVNVLVSSSARRVTEPLIADPRLRKVSFTGSTAVGCELVEKSAVQMLRVSMELGGNAPFIVLDDADVDAAVDAAMVAKMRNGGEACTAANRFLVHTSIQERFATRLAERMGGLRVGHGLEPDVDTGPLIDADAVRFVEELVGDATNRGAQLLCGGGALDRPGSFFSPTVLASVPVDARAVNEEIFGPVAPITSFDDDDEVVALANATEYGLVAYLITEDLRRAVRVAERLEVGMVGINRGLVSNPAAPFGGVKHSGLGREGGLEGIDEYLETQYLSVPL